jgi:signal transduction histidine kinase/ActR/RegA family two-component response regulator
MSLSTVNFTPSAQTRAGSWWGRLAAWAGRGRFGLRRELVLARRRAEQAEGRLAEVINLLPEGVVFLDAEGRFVLWNDRYAEFYHRTADLLKPGASIDEAMRAGIARGEYPDAEGRAEAWIAERLDHLAIPGARHEQRLADGRRLLVEERRAADGGTVGLRIDVTEMKRQAEALEAALGRAEAANQAKTEFLANLSHEIRTPLNAVIGLADVLRRDQLQPSQRQLLQTIVDSADCLNVILSDLLDYSRLEAGKVAIREEAFDLADLVERITAPHAARAAQKGVAFDVAFNAERPALVTGDPHRLGQILGNLLDNAVKFTREGSIAFTVSPAAKGDRFFFEVRDTGAGFDAEDAERLFARFQQADGSATREFGGLGLGLAICRQLAALMGGTVVAHGQRGKGAVFTLTLPLAAAEAPVHSEADEAAPAELDRVLRVLVTDDNATNRKVAELILAAIGAQVTSAENGAEAVEAVSQGRFDLILMDIQMPVMDGLTAIRRIRALETSRGLPRTPVVVLSANSMPEQLEASAAAGADEHLGKPIRADDLIAAIIRVVESEPETALQAEG